MYNILIVEDDKPSGLILKKLLTKEGYNITGIYESGEKTLEVIKNVTKPDLVLMDISLSGKIDGIETAEKLFNEYNRITSYNVCYTKLLRLYRYYSGKGIKLNVMPPVEEIASVKKKLTAASSVKIVSWDMNEKRNNFV